MPIKDNQFFTYMVPFLALAGGTTISTPLNFDQQSDFMWLMNAYDVDVGAAAHSYSTRDYPLVNLLITPTSTAQFMNVAAPVVGLFGNGESPFILPQKMLITKGTQLTFTATNRTAATTYNLYLMLIGYKIFN